MAPAPPAQNPLTNVRNGAVNPEMPMNMTLPQSSPLIRYTPSSTVINPTDGWKTHYSGGEFGSGALTAGMGASIIMTSMNGGNATINFNGTAIYIHGRTSPDMQFVVTLDGEVIKEPRPRGPLDGAYLVALTSLSRATEHQLTLTTMTKTINRVESTAPQLSIDDVIITAASGMTGGQVVTSSVDINDPTVNSFGLVPSAETRHPSFTGVVAKSDSGPAWASYTFEGSAITITGNTNIDQGQFQVVLDGKAKTYSARSRTFVPNAVLFSQGGLDPMETHTVNISTINGSPMGLGQFQVSRVEGGTPMDFNLNLAEAPPAQVNPVPIGIILGAVFGGLALILVIIVIIVLVIRRRRARRAAAAEAEVAAMEAGRYEKPSPGGMSTLSRNDSGRYNSAMFNLFTGSETTIAASLAPEHELKPPTQARSRSPQPRLEVTIPNPRLSTASNRTMHALIHPNSGHHHQSHQLAPHQNPRPGSITDSMHTIDDDDGSVLTLAFQSSTGHTPTGSAMDTAGALSPETYPDFAQVVPVVAEKQRRLSLLGPPPAALPGRGRRSSDPPTIEVTEADMADVMITPVAQAPPSHTNSRRVHWALSQVAEIRTTRD